jgi:hypothetical protein
MNITENSKKITEVLKMKYYRVREHANQFPKNPKVRDGNNLIGMELYTEREFNKLPYVYVSAFEMVEIPKNKTYWSFGARFERKSI